jgi:hypothetical protein
VNGKEGGWWLDVPIYIRDAPIAVSNGGRATASGNGGRVDQSLLEKAIDSSALPAGPNCHYQRRLVLTPQPTYRLAGEPAAI